MMLKFVSNNFCIWRARWKFDNFFFGKSKMWTLNTIQIDCFLPFRLCFCQFKTVWLYFQLNRYLMSRQIKTILLKQFLPRKQRVPVLQEMTYSSDEDENPSAKAKIVTPAKATLAKKKVSSSTISCQKGKECQKRKPAKKPESSSSDAVAAATSGTFLKLNDDYNTRVSTMSWIKSPSFDCFYAWN